MAPCLRGLRPEGRRVGVRQCSMSFPGSYPIWLWVLGKPHYLNFGEIKHPRFHNAVDAIHNHSAGGDNNRVGKVSILEFLGVLCHLPARRPIATEPAVFIEDVLKLLQ